MKQWLKLTGKAKSQTPPAASSHPQQNQNQSQNQNVVPFVSQASAYEDEVSEILAEDSIEVEFKRGTQEVKIMRSKYAGLLKVAAKLQQCATSFAETSEELGRYFADSFGTMQEGEVGDIFLGAARVEEEVAQLLQKYAIHVKQTIYTPTENLLKDLDQVEETKKEYEEKRQAYEKNLIAAKSWLKNGKTDADVPGKEERDEIAMTLGCRLLSLDQRRPRNLLTQLVRHHTAQVFLFKHGLSRLQALEATVQRVVREKNISRKLNTSEVEDDEEGEDDMDDEDDEGDRSSNTPSEPLSSQGVVGSVAESGELSNDPGSGPVLGELKELPKEMPVEWTSLLSSLDQTLKGIGAETMDVGDAVFAMNAVLSAASYSGKDITLPRKPRSVQSYFSAPLSSDGTPLNRLNKTGKTTTGESVFKPISSTPSLPRRLPSGYGADPVGTAAYHVTHPPSTPPRAPPLSPSQPLNSQSAEGVRSFNFRPSPVSLSGPLPQPRSLDSFVDTNSRKSPSSHTVTFGSPLSAALPPVPKSFVSHSGPILNSLNPMGQAKPSRVSPVSIPPFAMHMSGPLPSPSSVEKAQKSERKTESHTHSFSFDTQQSTQHWPTPNSSETSANQKRPRPRYYSGPIDPSNLSGLVSSAPMNNKNNNTNITSSNVSNTRRAEPLYKSGPIGKSALNSFSPPSSPPHIAELHRLPPPPLTLPSTSFTSTLSQPPNVASQKSALGTASPLPLPTPNETRSAPSSSTASLLSSKTNSRSFGVSKKPSVPTILSEGSDEGESPGKSVSPRLFRTVSISSTESGASTIAPLRSEDILSYARALDRQALTSGRNSFSAPFPLIISGEQSALQALGSNEREELLAHVSREDFEWGLVEGERPSSVATVPLWKGMSPTAKETFFRSLASAVISRRQSESQTGSHSSSPKKP